MRHTRSKIVAAVCLSLIVAAAWVFLGRARRLAYVDSAIGSIRVLVAAETKYAQTHPQIGYTWSLSDLRDVDSATAPASSGRQNEYVFEISGCSTGAKSANSRFQIKARPLLAGMPAFCADQSGVVKYDDGGSGDKCLADGSPIG